jgi:cytoskeletal protein RodZ
MKTWFKLFWLSVVCGICGVLGYFAIKSHSFFYPPPGI